MISEHPISLQLRNLQVLGEIAVEKNSTIVFPAQFLDCVREISRFVGAERAVEPDPPAVDRPSGSAPATSDDTSCHVPAHVVPRRELSKVSVSARWMLTTWSCQNSKQARSCMPTEEGAHDQH